MCIRDRHYSPVEKLAQEFLPEHDPSKQRIFIYKRQLSGFFAATKIYDYMKLMTDIHECTEVDLLEPIALQKYEATHYRRLKVVLNLDRKLSEISLSYVDKVWRSVAEEFDLPLLTVVIDNIVEGSLVISWLVLPHVVEMISVNSPKAVNFVREHKIIHIAVDNCVIYDEELMVSTSY